ncbi:MAG: BrxA/BrxB family bacilliredoxin [Candidatus Hydrogenedentota bacterium]
MPPLYDPEAVKPMWEELAAVGVMPLSTPEEVDALFENPQGAAMVVINSVCGCSAAACRPGVKAALQNDVIPDKLATVFAGMETEAVSRLREYIPDQPPSSPNVIIFKDGKLLHMLHRSNIELMGPKDVADNLVAVFNEHCTAKGPSVSREVYEQTDDFQQCGSTIPLYPGN